jgi:hypothetical protein
MSPNGTASAALVRADVLVLLREKRYEEALAVLYRARSESPGSGELQKSIDQIKEFLIGAYAKRLGGLDQIARPIPVTASRSPDAVLVSRYIDGTSTLGDVARMSPLGQLRTLQVLVSLYPKPEPAPKIVVPRLGLPPPEDLPEPTLGAPLREPEDFAPPETERRPSPPAAAAESVADAEPAAVAEPVAPPETEEARQYREQFTLGTAAFVQRRFADAVAAFEACARLRPGDGAAEVMLRRSRRDLESL